MQLRFHDVAVVVESGAQILSEAFGAVLVTVPLSTPHVVPGRAIRLRLTEVSQPVPFPDASSVDEDEHGHPRMRGASVEAIVDLANLAIDVRRWPTASLDSTTARTSVLTWALCLALRELGIVPLHAAALVHGDRAIVIVGDSGVGKTTTALALVAAGCVPLHDDHVFVRRQCSEWDLLSAPESFRVTPETLAAFSHLGTRGQALPEIGKHEFTPTGTGARRCDRFHGEVQLLFPRQHSQATMIHAMASAEALGELMVASRSVTEGGRARTRRHAAILAQLADASRPVRIDLGGDLLKRPEIGGRELLRLLER